MANIEKLQKIYDQLDSEISENIDDAIMDGYDYLKTDEGRHKLRQREEIIDKLRSAEVEEGFNGKARNNFA